MKIILIFSLLAVSYSSFGAWYRGNTHAHTILSNHGDATPDEVANWYHGHGYNFLVVSEHNNFIDPSTIKIKNARKDFVLVPGVELTGSKNVHTTALNVKQVVPWKTSSTVPAEILKEHVERIHAQGGEAISNHPNYEWALSVNDLFEAKELKLFELYNGHPHVNVAGDKDHISTEEMWDELLSKGKRIFAVSSDDAHHFHKHSHELSNPGRGWIMVESEALTPEELVKSMTEGNFYASNGVMLSEVKRGPEQYQIKIDLERTDEILKSGKHMLGEKAGRDPGLKVEFIGQNGKVLHIEEKFDPKSKIVFANFSSESSSYIRAKIIYTIVKNNKNISFYAWTQPWWK